jgi:hypothetical protein
MTTRTPQQIGANNKRAGKAWELACADWLRRHGFPNASREVRNGRSDILGIGDMALETTITTWRMIWQKLGQAERDAKTRDLTDFCVWRKHTKIIDPDTGKTIPGVADPGEGAVIMPARIFWPLMADLDAYRRAEMDFHDTWEKAFSAGFAAGVKGETA